MAEVSASAEHPPTVELTAEERAHLGLEDEGANE